MPIQITIISDSHSRESNVFIEIFPFQFCLIAAYIHNSQLTLWELAFSCYVYVFAPDSGFLVKKRAR